MSKKTQAAAKRASKPLAWFLNEQLEKNSMETIMDQQQQEQHQRESPSPSIEIRKCSVDSLASSINSTKLCENNNKEDGLTAASGNNKKRGKKGGRQRVKKVSVNFTIAGSENKEPVTKAASAAVEETKQPVPAFIAPASSVPNAALLMNNTKERKEDYWYYDPLSDGFYYENNGSRGWKKRNPKIHGPPPAAAPKKVPEIEKIIEQQKLQKLTNQKLLNQIGAAPSVKYYDPQSDGYFFEMASVDGWRRRQAPPVVPSSASSSSSGITAAATVTSSVANCKPMNIPTSSMVAQNINQQQQPQHHGYHAFGSFSSTTATPTPSPAGSFMPQPPAMTHAQLEEMIVRHPSLVASMNKSQRLGGIFDNEPCIPSNSSTTSSEELTSSPPPMIAPEHSLLMQHFRRTQQQQHPHQQHLQQSNSASMLINGGSSNNNNITTTASSSSCQTTNNAFSVGSADEPYEFYWSDNEKASSISSYDDMGDKEQSIPRESVIGGQRRPTTLSVVQENNKPKPWWDTPLTTDHRFDVDKFIADLPSFDDEKILRNLTALPTPLSSDRHSIINQNQQHSNLVTPLKENSWWYGSSNGGDRNIASSSSSNSNPNSASRNLEKIDYDKIWRTPIIN